MFTLLLLPDTKHLPLEVIHQRWATHWLWRRVYRKHQSQHENGTWSESTAGTSAAGVTGGISLQQTGSLQLFDCAVVADAAVGPAGSVNGAGHSAMVPGQDVVVQQQQQRGQRQQRLDR